jgi:hypothetical protein
MLDRNSAVSDAAPPSVDPVNDVLEHDDSLVE